MLTVRSLYCPAAGVLSTEQTSRMRGRRHAAASHFLYVSASTTAKGLCGARVAAIRRGGFVSAIAVAARRQRARYKRGRRKVHLWSAAAVGLSEAIPKCASHLGRLMTSMSWWRSRCVGPCS